jgi:hypothetical protein
MRRTIVGATLLALALLLGSTLAAQDTKPAKGDKTDSADTEKPAAKPKPKPKEKFDYGAQVVGKLTRLEGSTKNFTVQVTYAEPDPGRIVDNQNHYNRRMAEISNERNPLNRQRQLIELQADMARRQANAYNKKTRDIDFDVDEKLKVRIVQPATEYDDKGKPKTYTKAELKALKGPDTTLPGYMAEYEQLRAGQIVKVFVAKQKQEKTKPAAKTDPKTLDPEFMVDRPKAVMVLIMADPPPQP